MRPLYYVVLPCGCRLTETTVLGMCRWHENKIREQKLETQRAEAEFFDAIERAKGEV